MSKVIKPGDDLADLISAGFEPVTDTTPKRLLVGSQGLERHGKTKWATSTPGPVGYIGLDFGHEGVIGKNVTSDRRIIAYYKNVPPVEAQSEYLAIWQEVQGAIFKVMDHPKIRTVVLDSGSDIWELLRLAQFGKLNERGDIKKLYPEINQAYKSLIRKAYDREINLIVTHKVKKLYMTRTVSSPKGQVEQEYWDGKSYERAGFGEGGYLVQVQIEHLYDPDRGKTLQDKFGIRVIDCRQNMEVQGLELWGKSNNFATLAQYIFPDSDESDWA